jgi:tetratricopeptide (TPR) repeat protein
MGTMPKVSASRIFVKQILKPEEDESVHEVPRLIRVWDRRLKKDMYPKVLEYWTKTLQDIMPEMQNSTGTPTTTTAASVSGAGLQSRHNASSTSLATHLTRQLSLMGSSTKSMDFSRSQSCNTSVYSSDDLKDKLNKVVYICKEFFKFAEAKNKELFLRMSVAGWKAMSSVLPEDNPLAMVALQLQVGYAYLHAFEFVETQRGFTEERECIKCFEQCLGQLQRDEFYMQRAGAWFGLAQAYKNRREGNHIENLLRSASYLRDFLSVCTFEVDPHRCIAAHQEIGDIYIEAGKIQLANEFLVSALNHLKDSDGTGWNTLAGVKFLRAHIHCKLAEACEKAKAGRDPEKDPEYQAQVKKGIENYEVPAP